MRAYLPRGNALDDATWSRRHLLVRWVLLLHLPVIAAIGLALGNPLELVAASVVVPAAALLAAHVLRQRSLAALAATTGLLLCSTALVVLTRGTIEAHFHFFVIIGLIVVYQAWAPFLWHVLFTVLSHGVGATLAPELIFEHRAGQENPWLWAGIHGIAVLAACGAIMIFWRFTEDEQAEKEALARRLATADVEIGRRQFTADMLVNLARRNQAMLYRQLDIINQLEEKERDPDALAELFKLDHLATRVRRNAENLLVIAGEQPPRTWSAPVPLRDVVRAAIAETEDLDRVVFAVDDRISVLGHTVADLTHLLAELTENAVRFSPPDTAVTIRVRPDQQEEGGYLLTIEDWGVGMPPAELAAANELLATAPEVDLGASQRLGFHVVARLAARHDIKVSLQSTPGSGITAVVRLPASVFATDTATTSGQSGPAALGEPSGAGMRGPTATGPGWNDGGFRPAATPDGSVGSLANGAANAPVSSPVGAANGVVGGPVPATPGAATGATPGSGTTVGGLPKRERHPNTPRVPVQAPASVAGNERLFGGDAGWSGWWEAPGNPAPGAVLPPPRTADPDDTPAPGARSDTPAEPAAPTSSGPAQTGPTQAAPNHSTPAQPAPAQQGPAQAGLPSRKPRPRPEPTPQAEEPAEVAAPSGRKLRRRIPQTHLAPELRTPTTGSQPETTPDQLDASASALSRYQASRMAAQAAVDGQADAGQARRPHEGDRG